MEQDNLEQRTYECPSNDHVGNDTELYHLKYLNGSLSAYYFCEPCSSIYSIMNGEPDYVDVDTLEYLPEQLIYKNRKGMLKIVDPMDLIEGEAD